MIEYFDIISNVFEVKLKVVVVVSGLHDTSSPFVGEQNK